MSQEGKGIASKGAFEHAAATGKLVVVPTSYQLFIDIDSEEAYQAYERNLHFLNNWAGVLETHRTPSPSGEPGHYHIVVNLQDPVSDLERILLQALLGSDPIREWLSWGRVKTGDPVPTLFLELGQKLLEAK